MMSSLCTKELKRVSHQRDLKLWTLKIIAVINLRHKISLSFLLKNSFHNIEVHSTLLMINVPSHISEHRFPSIPKHAFPVGW